MLYSIGVLSGSWISFQSYATLIGVKSSTLYYKIVNFFPNSLEIILVVQFGPPTLRDY